MRQADQRHQSAKGKIAWSIAGISTALGVAALFLTYANSVALPTPLLDAVLPPLLGFCYPAVGAIILSRKSENRLGWVYVLIGTAFAVSIFAQEYALYGVRTNPGSLPGAEFVFWLQTWSLIPGFPGGLTLLLLLFPDGKLPSKRWRVFFWTVIAVTTLVVLMSAVAEPLETAFRDLTHPNPYFNVSIPNVGDGLWMVIQLSMLASAVSLGFRYRSGTQEERRQLRLFAIAAALIPTSFLLSWIPFLSWAWVLGVIALAFGIPIASAVSILKYRLFDVEFLISKGVLYAILATVLTLLYVGVVVGIGALVGQTGESSLGLSVLAASVVAILFQPTRNRIQTFANRIVFGKRANPYEVMSRFSDQLASTYTEDVLSEMARLVGEGTGAKRAEIWLKLGDDMRLEASWPESPNGEAGNRTGGEGVDVRHGGELMGRLEILLPPSENVTDDQRRLLTNLASQAGFILRNVKLVEDLRSSRQRIVAAQDQERRRMERDLHDGAQQQLVAMSVKLSLAQAIAAKDPSKTSSILEELKGETSDAVESLRDLARGIFPPLLSEQGLGPSLHAHAQKMGLDVRINDQTDGSRSSQDIEAAVYFTIREALQNASKHASNAPVTIDISTTGSELWFTVADRGPGFDPATASSSSGLQNMRDRIEAVGGSLRIKSTPSGAGSGTTVEGRVPAAIIETVS